MMVPPAFVDFDTALLRSFVVVAEERHFGRAAERLHISQPALSKRLRRLEETIGGPVLRRGYRDVRLTEPGRVLLERTRLLLREADRTIELSREAVRGEAGLLRIGFGVASITHLLPRVLLRFRRTHPKVQIEMRDMSSPAQAEALRRGEIDLGFVRQPLLDDEIESLPILHERLAAAVGTPASWRDGVGLRSLALEPFVVCSRSISASYYDHVIAVCRAAGFAPRIVTETNDLFALLQLVRAGVGVALVPSAAADMRVPGVRIKRVGLAAAAWDIALARRKRERGPLVDAFVQVAREVSAERSSRRAQGTKSAR
jgi:DNA-binding transcriptional LysR family regulator